MQQQEQGDILILGIAIANKIKEEEPNSIITFIGTDRGLENDLVPRAGYELKRIEAYGISRELSLKNIKRLYKTIKGTGQAKKIVESFKPDIVIGTGGYICGPIAIAARKKKIPIVLHESNAFPGVTVKMLAQKADCILAGFEDTKERLPKAKKVIVTGTPTKVKPMQLGEKEKENIKREIGLKNDKPVVLVFGGSQGAKSINEAIIGMIENKLNQNYQIIWAVGHSQYDILKEELENKGKNIANIPDVKIVPYIYNMNEVMNMVDLVVCRSGALTITEISIVGKPAIFIPFPKAAENHQEYNARVLEKIGAAKIILDKDLTCQTLANTIDEIIEEPKRIQEMGRKAKEASISQVDDKIYKAICDVMKSYK